MVEEINGKGQRREGNSKEKRYFSCMLFGFWFKSINKSGYVVHCLSDRKGKKHKGIGKEGESEISALKISISNPLAITIDI